MSYSKQNHYGKKPNPQGQMLPQQQQQQQQQLPSGPHPMHKPVPMGAAGQPLLNYDPRFGPQQVPIPSNIPPGAMFQPMQTPPPMGPLSPVPQSVQNNPSLLSDPRQMSIFNSSAIGAPNVGPTYPGQIISHPNSVGCWLFTDSMYGNNVLPILPRF